MSKNNEQEKEIQELKQQLQKTQEKLEESENKRKLIHDELCRVKGNIRVMCRVRPLTEQE